MAPSIIARMSALPNAFPRAIYSTADVRDFDRRATESLGIAGFELMQRAGRAALAFLRERWPTAVALDIYCGAGNNAGDGYVVAALAKQAGLRPRIYAVIDPNRLSGDAARAFELARETSVEIEIFEAGAGTAAGRRSADLAIDALLGTGLVRDVDGAMAEAVARINSAGLPVLALDVPTGLDSDTGAVRGAVVEADATITFVGLKSGLFLGAGPACRGALGFSDLELPRSIFETAAPRFRRLDPADRLPLLKPRSRIAHKGMNGRVLVVGGTAGMAGAARMAAEAALRAGAGLVHVAAAPESVAPIMAGRPEIMCRGVTSAADFEDWSELADVIVVGPGLGRGDASRVLAEAMLATTKPLVVDADALHCLASRPARSDRRVLTPHPGEAALLLDSTAGRVQAARDDAVTALLEAYGGTVVLKGACTLVGHESAGGAPSLAVCDFGNPGMASGGMGDVLAGLIAGLIAQFGLTPAVVETGVLVHALAGDDAAAEGERGLLAMDLMPHIRRRVNPA